MRRSSLLLPLVALQLACAAPLTERTASPAFERIVSVAGGAGRLRVSDGGTGEPAVLLLHGLGGDLEVWRAQLDHLRASRRAVAYDQRGHGGSEPARGGVYTLEALAEDLEAVRSALGLGQVVLVAHSMSGGVATTYAGRHPDRVAGILYLDAVGDFHVYPVEKLRAYVEGVQASASSAEGRRAQFDDDLKPPALPATRERVHAGLDRMDPQAFGKLFGAMLGLRDAKERLAPYRGPAAAVEVAAEPDPTNAAAVLGLPRRVVPGASHWLQLDAPAVVNAEIDAFLASPRPRR